MFTKGDVLIGKVKYRNSENAITLYNRQKEVYQTYPDIFSPVLKPSPDNNIKWTTQISSLKLQSLKQCKFNEESDVAVHYSCFHPCGSGSSSPGVIYFYDSSAMSSMMIPRRLESLVKGV